MKEEILDIYERFHKGKENVITREMFIAKYGWKLPDMSDRTFRLIYSQFPICTCDKGGFYPIRKEEILEYRDYLRKKAIPLFERFNRVCDAHPELAADDVQGVLFPVTHEYEQGHLINCPCSIQLSIQQENKNDK